MKTIPHILNQSSALEIFATVQFYGFLGIIWVTIKYFTIDVAIITTVL